MSLPALLPAVALTLTLVACGASDTTGTVEPTSAPVTAGTPSPGATKPVTPSREPSATASPTERRPSRVRGIDVSHHQGTIDWPRVAGDGIAFAYLKATEGSTFSDPRFETNWAGARDAGLRVGGYHYFTLCSPPEPQADHFTARLESVGFGRGDLPPVVDLELIGNCDPPPSRPDMLVSAQTFVERVERATGRRVVAYFHPGFEDHYRLVRELGRRLWVRSVGPRAPTGDWWIWQRDDRAAVAGIDGPVDLDVMRRQQG